MTSGNYDICNVVFLFNIIPLL